MGSERYYTLSAILNCGIRHKTEAYNKKDKLNYVAQVKWS